MPAAGRDPEAVGGGPSHQPSGRENGREGKHQVLSGPTAPHSPATRYCSRMRRDCRSGDRLANTSRGTGPSATKPTHVPSCTVLRLMYRHFPQQNAIVCDCLQNSVVCRNILPVKNLFVFQRDRAKRLLTALSKVRVLVGEPSPPANKPAGLFFALCRSPQLATVTLFVVTTYSSRLLRTALRSVNQESGEIALFSRALRLSGLWRPFG